MNMAESIWKDVAADIRKSVADNVWDKIKTETQEIIYENSNPIGVILSVNFVPHFHIISWHGVQWTEKHAAS